MKYTKFRPHNVFICLAALGIFFSIGAVEAGSGASFKRVKVEKRPLGSRINVQIKPEESYYHKQKSENASPKDKTIAVGIKPADEFDWFWDSFNHDLSTASLLRLNNAEQQLTKAPNQYKNLSPSFEVMQKLASTYGAEILLATLNKDISPALVLAVIGVESNGKIDAVSSAGAVGLMQLIPETAKRFNVTDSTDPKQNIRGGVAYLDWLIKEFKRDPVLALAGYNAGENAVKQHNGVPPFAETRGYVPKVVAAWKVAKALCKTPPKYATDGCVFDLNPKAAD